MTIPEPFADLVRRYTCDPDDPPDTSVVSFSDALAAGDDDQHVLGYLHGLGAQPRTLADLAKAIRDLDDEEELGAHEVAEGLAVSFASDDRWVLFTA